MSHRPNACNLCHLDQTRQWAGDSLSEWYGQPQIDVEPDCQNIADGVLLALKGNALQRAVTTWAMGCASAQAASGSDWMVPILADRLTDTYAPVRLMAYSALRTIPGYEGWDYDFLAAEDVRAQVKQQVVKAWSEGLFRSEEDHTERVLVTPDGRNLFDTYMRLIRERDTQPFRVSE